MQVDPWTIMICCSCKAGLYESNVLSFRLTTGFDVMLSPPRIDVSVL